jgi:hypothetical protein
MLFNNEALIRHAQRYIKAQYLCNMTGIELNAKKPILQRTKTGLCFVHE